MPEMDGLQLCRAIRSIKSEHYTYIILLTSQDSKEDLISGLEAGADEYLVKPVNQTELMVRLKTARRILDLESSLKKSLEEIKELSIHDPLTGAFNRGYLDQKLPQEIKRAFRYVHNLSIILTDIDHFKKINDTFGHQAGDAVLKRCVDYVHGSIRKEIDWLARFGGEEFLLVLPETPPQGCLIVAERLRQLVEKTPVVVDGKDISFTASFGVATLAPAQEAENITSDQLLKKADDCLYQAKQSGRNKVVTCVVS
jgi:diguanylate cyclase (GGDEF)-like protein